MSRERHSTARPSIDVIICAFTEQRLDELNLAIDSVLAQEPRPEKVVVVIDHNESLLEKIAGRTDITTIPNRHSQGLSGGRNTGVEIASAEVVAFLDDDARARPGWLAAMAQVLSDPTVVGVGGTVVADWRQGRPAWFPAEFDWVVGCTHLGMPTEDRPIRNPVGASMAFRTEAIREAGGFDVSLGRVGTRPVGCEETELAIKIRRKHGAESIRMAPASVVDHLVPAERGRLGYFVRRCWAEGRSKAVVTRRTTNKEGLESERAYLVHTLPRGMAQGMLRPLSGWGRAAAIVAGTAVTTLGYIVGRFRRVVSVSALTPHQEFARQEAG